MPSQDARTTAEATDTPVAASLDHDALLKDLQKQVAALETDLRERAHGDSEQAAALKAEYERAVDAGRTEVREEPWLEERVVQIAAAWVLACVFVRFCEDNGLVPDARLSGPGERLAEAQDNHDAFFRKRPELNDRDWLKESFRALGREHEIAEGLFDPAHNPLWELDPSYGAASRLLSFWRERGPDGRIRHDFTDPALNTRFLGDLYQHLSEHARKTYALLQTPEFVEEFILDLTLDPALEEFDLAPAWKHVPEGWRGETSEEIDENGDLTTVVRGLRCIDPACGSGHFLLGLFRRVLAAWREAEPGTENWTLVRRALESVHGADKNPFAVSIARFRLLVDMLKECGVDRLSAAPSMPIRIAVADSLLHGREAGRETDPTFDDVERGETFTYRTEDVRQYVKEADLLGRGSYHVVVANPPYITVKDKAENENYRKIYWACSGKYALSVPFAQRIFELAVRASGDQRNGGFTGQITANSFMKREFGATLIESFFHGGPYKDPQTRRRDVYSGVELTHVLDTSGAFIPGHGTPTVILAGRNQVARQAEPIRAVLGVRGEPSQPEDPARGEVWRAIVSQWRKPGVGPEEWVSVEDVERQRFAGHPWSLGGGGAGGLLKRVEGAAEMRLSDVADSLGITCFTLEDDLYLMPKRAATTAGILDQWTRPMVTGDLLRDWSGGDYEVALFPYSSSFAPIDVEDVAPLYRLMWPARTTIANNILFGRKTKVEGGLKWSEYGRLTSNKLRTPLSITFAFVATHNHFVLDRGGKVFNRSAPVIKLPEDATEERHLELLGVLNSSVACFWLKQVSHDKGIRGEGGGFTSTDWERFFEFTGTKLQEFPLTAELPLALARQLDTLAQELAAHEPTTLSASSATPPTHEALEAAEAEQERIRARLILLQEELDWTVYGLYGLLAPAEVARTTLPGDPADLTDTDVLQLELGQRAFEIALARSGADTAWFDRHESTPVTEIPSSPDWPESYRQIVQARLDLIADNKDIRLIERPEYKRRWSTKPWKDREAAALRSWLLDAMEREELWFEERDSIDSPCPLTIFQLADALRHDSDVQDVAALYADRHLGKRDVPLSTVLAAVVEPEHVPYLAALRYKESGLRKRAQWEQVWEEQREEDRHGERRDIKVPPKYTSADFLKHSYWSNRGKLDVPKERFVSYPGASPDNDPSLLIGWAGWNHRHQAEAVVNLLNDRLNVDGWRKEDPRFVPLLAGLAEVMPWVKQWYDEYDDEWEGNPAEDFNSALVAGMYGRQLSLDDLTAWRPEKKRGRAGK
ncbi:DNA methylase [Streptomyces violaceusniger]|uniref:site-specific DNA-methyltransferase (adenine-specific) n=2 Tax=Streptomyces violaceusniger group TaxID=2839105 RepID=A0ABD5JC81_9ACTN|nr:BREX-2 system adenine-specific DNA-methyltransferase PglX [Streptomyces violaceusniger]KUL56754.1 DNA methylase [Streptomyces violaceusniger]MEE4585258.1 BREX-2 system adenine-specific DNA-methyltransferase PglX [Streptomyces sp. DSM 41602]